MALARMNEGGIGVWGMIDNTYFRRGVVRITSIITYLFITYIVTSKPKRISVAAGVVHMIVVLNLR